MRRGLVLAALVLAGCGGGAASGSPRGAPAKARVPAHRRLAPSRARLPLGPDPLRGAAARRAAVPILMYHVIAAPRPGVPYPELFVAPARFAAEMRALRAAGFHATTLTAVLRAWRTGAPLPRRPVVVSFDDGYLSQYTAARPVLARLGWPGVLNLEVDNLRRGDLPAPLARGLIRAGWEVDSHTLTHPDLTTVDDARLRRELVVSGRDIRRRLHVPAALFCYPSGRFDAHVEAAVRAAGYAAATTTEPGWATPRTDRFALPRIRVDGGFTVAQLLAAVRAARP